MDNFFTVAVPVKSATDVIKAYRKARNLGGVPVRNDLAKGEAVIALPNELRSDFEAHLTGIAAK